MKNRLFVFMTSFLLAMSLAACNTMRGAGEDIEDAGDAIEEAADDAEDAIDDAG